VDWLYHKAFSINSLFRSILGNLSLWISLSNSLTPKVTISDLDLRRKPRRVCFRSPPRLSIFYIIFLLCYLLVSLFWLVYIANPCIILVQFWNQPCSLQTPFLSLSSWFWTFLVLLKLGPLGVTRAQHISWGQVLSEFISGIWNLSFCYQNLTLRYISIYSTAYIPGPMFVPMCTYI
jgi:hypothetical protein